MIKSFKDKGLRRFFEDQDAARLSVQNLDRVTRILARFAVAATPEEMNLPGWKFHGLKGDRKRTYAVWATGNWRITFAFDGEDAVDVDLEDYR